MGYRHRYMYYATGLPGWIRFGYSPGWVGRSPSGLPPAAQYLTQTGQIPQFMSWLGLPQWAYPQVQYPTVGYPYSMGKMDPKQEVDMLKRQADTLEDQLEGIRKRIKELEGEKK